MNRSFKAGAAIFGATALLAGGGTFASWSDWDSITGNTSGASKLVLDVTNGGPGAEQNFALGNLAPGEHQDFEIFLASTNGDAVPDARLLMSVVDLKGTEDGCTSTSEETNIDGSANDDCTNTAGEGDFIDQVQFQTVFGMPAAGGCNPNLTGFSPSGVIDGGRSLSAVEAGGPLLLTDPTRFTQALDPRAALEPGEQVCVRIKVWLPAHADNASQGDSASYALQFEAQQIVGSSGGNGFQTAPN